VKLVPFVDRSMRNELSLFELSVHVNVICEVPLVAAMSAEGAAGVPPTGVVAIASRLNPEVPTLFEART